MAAAAHQGSLRGRARVSPLVASDQTGGPREPRREESVRRATRWVRPGGGPPRIWALEDTRLRTLHDIDWLGQVILDRTRSGSANTVGTLLDHLAAIELDWLYSEVLEHSWDDVPAEVKDLLGYDVRDKKGLWGTNIRSCADLCTPARFGERFAGCGSYSVL